MATVETAPADWYADPSQPGQQRYWDGAAWTEHTAPAAPPGHALGTSTFVAGAPQRSSRGAWAIPGVLALVALIVLAAISVPVFLSQREEAQDSALQSDLRNAAVEFELFYSERGHYPTSVTDDHWQSAVVEQVNSYVTPDGQAYCIEAAAGGTWWSYDSRAMGTRSGRC